MPAATAPASATQRAMSAGVVQTSQGLAIVARVCASPTCDINSAESIALALPALPPSSELATARITTLRIAADRYVIHLEAGEGARRWQAILAAPLAQSKEPLVIWSGATPAAGLDGAESANAVQITDPSADGTVSVIVGEVRPNLDLCGRPGLLSPRIVLARDLSLHHVKMQRLSAKDRETAQPIEATRLADPIPRSLARLIAVQGASSAVNSPLAAADGNPRTAWSEARGGEGRGEFLTLRAPSEVPVESLVFTFRPLETEVLHGASPKSFWITTTDRVFAVQVPEDGWLTPEAQYSVRFPEPLRSSCLAVVLGEAYVPRNEKDVLVSITEVEALSSFDGTTDLAGLAAALAGGGDRARAAAQVLLRGGDPAHRAALFAYGDLDDAGRQLVLDVLDNASCEIASSLHASVLASRSERVRQRAQDRVRRCGRRASAALVEVLEQGPGCSAGYENAKLCESAKPSKPGSLGAARLAAGAELAAVAPRLAVEHILPLIGTADAPSRIALRGSLARAARHPEGLQAIAEALRNPSTPAPIVLDLLRSAQDRAGELGPDATAAFARLATQNTDASMRYLLCECAGTLAASGDAQAIKFLFHRILKDPEPMVRARALEVARGLPSLEPAVMFALEDPNVRVRAAAAACLQQRPAAASYLVRRLMIDEWPMLRASAAKALAAGGGGAEADEALARASMDPSHGVRGAALLALGERGAKAFAQQVRDRAEDPEEPVSIRLLAVRALGRMCDNGAADTLTIYARRAGDPQSPEAASGLGRVAILALGRLHPADLRQRLEPLLTGTQVPAQVRLAAEAAIAETDVCRAISSTYR